MNRSGWSAVVRMILGTILILIACSLWVILRQNL
jgi:hypothetical protein